MDRRPRLAVDASDVPIDWRVLRLPTSSPPLPDEVAGYWQLRLLALNAVLSPARLAEYWGFDRPGYYRLDGDPASGGVDVDALSSLLRVPTDEFQRRFTTRPYWLALGAVNARTRRTGFAFIHGLPHFFRVCPQCLVDDQRKYGVAYIHRTHQLRSQACHVHRLVLQTSCMNCHAAICSKLLPTLIGRRCKCGTPWKLALRRESAEPIWQRLAAFSDAVLRGAPGELDPEGLRMLAIRRAQQSEKLAVSESIRSVLNRAYSLESSESARSWLNVQRARPSSGSLGQSMGGHLAIAVLTALGSTYEQTLAEVKRLRVELEDASAGGAAQSAPRRRYVAVALDVAKRMAESSIAERFTPSDLRNRSPDLYWLLCLKAGKWLEDWTLNHSGVPSSLPVPTVEEDRALIASAASRYLVKHARARARIRDEKWEREWASRDRLSSEMLTDLSLKLEMVREAHFAQPGRPIKLTLRVAAEKLRVSYYTLGAMVGRSSQLERLVPETSADYQARLIDWGMDQCGRAGLPLTWRNVMNQAMVNWRLVDRVRAAVAQRTGRPSSQTP